MPGTLQSRLQQQPGLKNLRKFHSVFFFFFLHYQRRWNQSETHQKYVAFKKGRFPIVFSKCPFLKCTAFTYRFTFSSLFHNHYRLCLRDIKIGFKWLPDHKRKIHCSMNLLLFIKAACSTQPGWRRTFWMSHLVKQEQGQILENELSTNCCWDKI